jgi:hypothetical protein
MSAIDRRLSEAIVVWTGWTSASSPQRDGGCVVEHFGQAATVELLPRICELEDEFYRSDARHTARTL